MPCKICDLVYENRPCSGIPYNGKKGDMFYTHEPERYILKSLTKETFETRYYRLRDECPCKDCLVKMMCEQGRLQCSPWYHFCRQIKPEDI
jgi:hypothetical protein